MTNKYFIIFYIMKICKKCSTLVNASLFISICALILASMAYFHKIEATEGFEDYNWVVKRGDSELTYSKGGKTVMKLAKNGDMTVSGSLTVDKDINVGADIIKAKAPYYITKTDGQKYIKYGDGLHLRNEYKGGTFLKVCGGRTCGGGAYAVNTDKRPNGHCCNAGLWTIKKA